MPYLLLLVALIVAFILAWPVLQRSTPGQIARGAGLVLFGVAVLIAVFALATGRPSWVILSLVLGLIALIPRLAGVSGAGAPRAGGRRRWSRGSGASSIETRYLKMALDHATGRVEGEVLAGRHEGRRVETMSTDELVDVIREAAIDDPQSAQLLEAYLDRIDPGWRADAGAGGGRQQGPGGKVRMTRSEALSLLGLEGDASPSEVRAAHRRLMREHHPDRGGDAEFAARLNEAKEVLLDGV